MASFLSITSKREIYKPREAISQLINIARLEAEREIVSKQNEGKIFGSTGDYTWLCRTKEGRKQQESRKGRESDRS